MQMQLDATADFICRGKWGKVDYPPPFGRDAFPEEAYIADIDAKTGASLKVRSDIPGTHQYVEPGSGSEDFCFQKLFLLFIADSFANDFAKKKGLKYAKSLSDVFDNIYFLFVSSSLS